jgi:hypothetical protein
MKHCILLLSFLYTITVYAQDSTQLTKPQFKLSVNYNSGLNYFGRTDSLKSTGVFPMAELWITPSFYVNAAPIFVNNALQKLDYAGTVATAGYQHLTDKWLTSLSVVKPFYKADAELVQSALKAQANLSVTHLNKVANITLGGDAKFSDRVDYGATVGIDHLFRIQNKDNSVLLLDPSFYTYAGTQQFSRTYTRKKKGLPLPGQSREEQVTESGTQFNILAYEVSMPIIFARNKIMLIATPSYILPQNLTTVPNRPDLSEKGGHMFYTTLSIKYTF